MTIELITAATLLLAWLAIVRHAVAKARTQRIPTPIKDTEVAVIYASQTGTAKELAQRTAEALGRHNASVFAMNNFSPAQLADYSTVLFIVSTYGEGDPPDMAHGFHGQMLQSFNGSMTLSHLNTGVLALGDSGYRHYCGFGRQLGQWLEHHGARPLFDTVTVDRCSPDALHEWQRHLGAHLQAATAIPDRYAPWQLAARRHVNPGSLGGACHELVLLPVNSSLPDWHAGDIAEVKLANGTIRDYSIASTAAEGELRLLVREHIDANGRRGLGSHWLTQVMNIGESVALHIRENESFHAPAQACPAVFIGNGTGIAGLRGLLQTRVQQGLHENWLIFGERQQAHDFHYGEQLRAWHAAGKIRRLDTAFSRDQAHRHYVQHCLHDAAVELKDWVARGAILYVCGSKSTMAPEVDRALRDILEPLQYTMLVQQGRLRRDVY